MPRALLSATHGLCAGGWQDTATRQAQGNELMRELLWQELGPRQCVCTAVAGAMPAALGVLTSQRGAPW
jgi:hypothetical protein